MGKSGVSKPTGKKPINSCARKKKKRIVQNPGRIKNRLKRSEMYGKYLLQKKAERRAARLKRVKEAEALGEDPSATKQTPRTLDNTREAELTVVRPDDEEIQADEAEDEFSSYFADETRPKLLLTTRPHPSAELFAFISDLIRLFPNCFYYPRRSYGIKEICTYATGKLFTHVLVLSEKSKVCNGLTVSHLPSGPTAFFKISNVVPSEHVPNHGTATHHVPELVLNGFGTRLGHRVGRFLGSLFPHNAQFKGRQVATFHNQRDYIFVRHHRYIFEEGKETSKASTKKKTRARLQELGPRFTLKMRWLQEGTFDAQFGEYEWYHKRKEMDTTRRRFHL